MWNCHSLLQQTKGDIKKHFKVYDIYVNVYDREDATKQQHGIVFFQVYFKNIK